MYLLRFVEVTNYLFADRLRSRGDPIRPAVSSASEDQLAVHSGARRHLGPHCGGRRPDLPYTQLQL